MTAYLYIYLIPIFFTILPIKFKNNHNSFMLFLYAIICSIFIGFRYKVGGDWGVYTNYLVGAYENNLKTMFILKDPGYMVLLWLSAKIGFSNLAVNLFCASIFMIGVHKLCKKQPYPWLAYTIAFPYLIVVVGMGYSRQALTIGIAMWCYSIWQRGDKYSYIKIALLIALGFVFHKSIIAISFLLVIKKRGFIIDKYIFLFFIPTISFLAYYNFEYIKLIWTYYVLQSNLSNALLPENSSLSIAEGARIRTMMNLPPCILFYYFYNRFKVFEDRRLLLIISFISILFFILAPYGSTLIDRMGLYFIAFQIIIYSRIPMFFKDSVISISYIYSIVILYILIFFIWFNFANSSIAWKPYQINLFQPQFYIGSWNIGEDMINRPGLQKSIDELEEIYGEKLSK